MAPLTGNQHWRLRTKHGRDSIFGDGDILLGEAYLYFDWCDRNPWLKPELVKHKGEAEQYDIPLGRPYSMDGLTMYLGVSGAYFRARKGALLDKAERKVITEAEEGVLDAIERIELICRAQQTEGAIVGVFSASLIARLFNYGDSLTTTETGSRSVLVTVRDQKTADMLTKLDELL